MIVVLPVAILCFGAAMIAYETAKLAIRLVIWLIAVGGLE
jgi:hypothetical protein